MDCMFSFVIPVYNASAYLEECIFSIINQDYNNLEIILVNDGSTDNSKNICEAYSVRDSRIKVINKCNEGVARARQDGVIAALGEYIICVDSDDWVEPNYCSIMNDVINNYNPDIICCGYYINDLNNQIECKNRIAPGFYSKEKLNTVLFPDLINNTKHQITLSLWAKVFRRTLLLDNMIKDVYLNLGEDVVSSAPCFYNAQSAFFLDSCFYHYRQVSNSITKGNNVYRWDGPIIRGKHLEAKIDMRDGDFEEQLLRSIVISLYTVVKSQFNRNDRYLNIIKDISFNLDNEYYKNALSKACFKRDYKGAFKCFLLKHHLYFLIKIIG